jgi:hypothetical protein
MLANVSLARPPLVTSKPWKVAPLSIAVTAPSCVPDADLNSTGTMSAPWTLSTPDQVRTSLSLSPPNDRSYAAITSQRSPVVNTFSMRPSMLSKDARVATVSTIAKPMPRTV